MKIDALKLLDGPIAVELDESVHVLQVEEDPEYEYLTGISGRVVFTRLIDGKVLLRGTVATRVRGRCIRCLEPVDLDLEAEVTLVYANDPDLLDETRRLDFTEDVVWFDGHVIEPLDDLRELLLLELPAYPSCELAPGKTCRLGSLKEGPVSFGAEETPAPAADAAPSLRAEKTKEPEWKAALRRASASRNPQNP